MWEDSCNDRISVPDSCGPCTFNFLTVVSRLCNLSSVVLEYPNETCSIATTMETRSRHVSLAITLSLLASLSSSRPVCRVSNATGSGKDDDTLALQAAIDRCASHPGGGVVHVPPGDFLTGTLFLRSNVTLDLAPGATIRGSARQEDFPLRWYTILAEGAENVGLTGGGTVSGQGWRYVEEFLPEKNVMVSWNASGACVGDECRPRLVGFVNCRNVSVWNVALEDPAYWCLHIANSDVVSIHNVSIRGDFNSPNTDGIDIDSSNNTVIEDCRIDTGDDAICAKTMVGPLYNLTVRRVWVRTKSCAVKVGSETRYDVVNLHFEDITVVDSHRGLGIQLRDAGNITNVTYANIQMTTRYYHPSWWGLAEPIYISACPRIPSTSLGFVTNILYSNITTISENGIFLSGTPKSLVNGLWFQNVSIMLARWTEFPGEFRDYRPGCQGLVKVKGTTGMFVEYVGEVWMEGLVVRWKRDLTIDVKLTELNEQIVD